MTAILRGLPLAALFLTALPHLPAAAQDADSGQRLFRQHVGEMVDEL